MALVNLQCVSDRLLTPFGSWHQPTAVCMVLGPGRVYPDGQMCIMMSFNTAGYENKQIERAVLHITIGTFRNWNDEYTSAGNYNRYAAGTIYAAAYAEPILAEMVQAKSSPLESNAITGSVQREYYEYTLDQQVSIDVTGLLVNNIYSGIFNVFFSAAYISTAYTETPVVYSRESAESSRRPFLEITYSEYTPKVDAAYPKETYMREGDAVDFNWSFSCQSGSTLAHSNLEISKDGTTFETLAEIDGSDTHLTVTDGMTAGTVYWRVTITDSLGATAVSDIAKFTVIGKPAAPIIVSISNDARPVIRWNATDQMGYRIAVYCGGVAIESEDVSKSDKVYYCKEFYPNGNIEIRLSIQSVYELWSDESTRIATIDAAVPETPDIAVNIVDCNAVITTAATGNLYLYRTCDGETVRIGTVTDGEFVDKTIPGGLPCTYFIRKYDGGYADSEEITVEVDIRGIIIDCGEIRVTASRSTEQFMMLDETTGRDMVIANYSGRAYPCIEVGEHKTQTIARKFFIDNANYQKLRKIHVSGDIMTYRDRDGNVMDCIISGTLTASRSRILAGYDIQATFSRVEGV